MSTTDPVVFLSFARTPMGGMMGELSSLTATQLGAHAVKGAVERSGLSPEQIERCYMGCVLPAGLGQAPARQAAIYGGLPNTVEATTINKMCGSAMQAAIMASDALVAGSADIIVAGGLESMSNAPYLNLKHRAGARIGHDRLYDHMFFDGLEDVYEQGKLMGNFAEDVAGEYQFTREAQDEFAITSLTRAQQHVGHLANEIVPITVKTRKGEAVIDTDEQPRNANIAKIPTLKPAFAKDGGITALSSFFPRIRKAYLIGEAANQFARTLDGKTLYEMSGTLDVAVARAAADAAASASDAPVVLLSPACASYDQYPNFEVRGDAFRNLVRKLPGVAVPRGPEPSQQF